MDALSLRGHEVALVGGCLRDALRGRTAHDFDLATDAQQSTILEIFARAIPIGPDTVMVPTPAGPVDVTPFRGGKGLEGDLARRDFTVNAIAWSAKRKAWIDPFGGRSDLESKTLRAVGSVADRLAEDPLRALRAARFVATLDLHATPGLAAEVAAAAPSLRRVAPERIRRELERLLLGAHASAGLRFLRESRVEASITPLDPGAPLCTWIDALPRRLEVRLAAWLLGTDPQVTLGPLRFGERRIAAVARRIARHPIDGGDGISRARLRHLLARTSVEVVDDLVRMREAETGGRLEEVRRELEAILCEEGAVIHRTDLAIDGREVMATLGLAPGRRVGEAIRYLMNRVLDDPSLNTAARLRDCLRQWSRETG